MRGLSYEPSYLVGEGVKEYKGAVGYLPKVGCDFLYELALAVVGSDGKFGGILRLYDFIQEVVKVFTGEVSASPNHLVIFGLD